MEESKLQALHDSLSKLRGHQGLGTNSGYSWQKKSSGNEKGSVDYGLPANALYANFVPAGTYDPEKGHVTDGDGRDIKRSFSDSEDSNGDSSEDEETKKRKRKEKRKAEKLEAKKQAKLLAKKKAKKEAKNFGKKETSDYGDDDQKLEVTKLKEPREKDKPKKRKREKEVEIPTEATESVTQSSTKKSKKDKTKKKERDDDGQHGKQVAGESSAPKSDVAKEKAKSAKKKKKMRMKDQEI